MAPCAGRPVDTKSLDGFSWEKISSGKMVAPCCTPGSVSLISLDGYSWEKISSRKMVAPCAGRPVPRLVPLAVGGLAVSPTPRLVVAPCAGRPGDTKSLDDGWKKFFRVIEENGGSPECVNQPPFLSTDFLGRKYHRGKWWLPRVCQPPFLSMNFLVKKFHRGKWWLPAPDARCHDLSRWRSVG